MDADRGSVATSAAGGGSHTKYLPPIAPVNAPSGASHPGHFANKVVAKAEVQPPDWAPTIPKYDASYATKQQLYLQRWEQIRPSVAQLSAEKQAVRRAALKREILGD